VRALINSTSITFEISFATPDLPDSDWVLVALDANQKNEAETSIWLGNVNGIAAEYALWCDLSNSLALPQPTAFLIDLRTANIRSVLPVTRNDSRWTLVISREILEENDANFNFMVIAAVGSNPLANADLIPDNGVGVVGRNSGAPWFYLEPTAGTISAGDSLLVQFKIDGTQLQPGQYQVMLVFDSNDPVQPKLMLPVHLTVNPKTGVATSPAPVELPQDFGLNQNYPNPFNPQTTIQIDLPRPCMVTLKIYNLNGAEVRTLLQGYLPGGSHQVAWNGVDHRGTRVGSGIYWIKLPADNYSQTRKMLLLP
jgi:hypothetical protein